MNVPFGDGNPSASIMIVGECWGEQEEKAGRPFMGASGFELDKMLHEAGILRSETYCTNLVNARPQGSDIGNWIAMKKKDVTPKHVLLRDKFVLPIIAAGYASLLKEIELVKPNVVIPVGNAALWALTGNWGTLKWRGSQLLADGDIKCIPTIHPGAILREYSLRPAAINDLKRAANERATSTYSNVPKYNFTIRPSLSTVTSILTNLVNMAEASEAGIWVEFDLETSPIHITCAGLSWSRTEALCIPITANGHGGNYWSAEEEALVVFALYKTLTHPKILVRGQNLLYDAQHTYRHWHFVPNVRQDTMLSHHTMLAGMKKSLDFQASLYCDFYVFWKELHHDVSNKVGA